MVYNLIDRYADSWKCTIFRQAGAEITQHTKRFEFFASNENRATIDIKQSKLFYKKSRYLTLKRGLLVQK
jgi:hypothetical protein